MARKYKYRTRCHSGAGLASTIGDFGAIASKFGPRGAVVVGLVGFIALYFLVPLLAEAWLAQRKANLSGSTAVIMGSLLDKVVGARFIRVSEWAGLATLILCSALAGWKALTGRSASDRDRRDASALSKLVARFLD